MPEDSLPQQVLPVGLLRREGDFRGVTAESGRVEFVGNRCFREKKNLEPKSLDLSLHLDRELKENSRKLALGGWGGNLHSPPKCT